MKRELKQEKRYRRHKRVRSKVFGTAALPRLCVFRSNKYIYAQLIDDKKGHTILSSSDLELQKSRLRRGSGGRAKVKSQKHAPSHPSKVRIGAGSKVDIAKEVGKLIAKKALKKKIEKVVFDRGGYKYHGRVKALAEGAREGGLKF